MYCIRYLWVFIVQKVLKISGNKFLFNFIFCCDMDCNHVFGCGNFCDMFFMIVGFVISVGVSNSVLFL